jgi:hypothetical protein
MHTMASWYSHYGIHGYMVAIGMELAMTTSGHLILSVSSARRPQGMFLYTSDLH